MELKRKVVKKDTSYVVALPREVLSTLGVDKGDSIVFSVEPNKVALKGDRISKYDEYSLNSLNELLRIKYDYINGVIKALGVSTLKEVNDLISRLENLKELEEVIKQKEDICQ